MSEVSEVYKVYSGHVEDGWNISIAQIWGSGPLLTIQCGKCKRRFDKRVRPAHRPVVSCGVCGAPNQLDITI
jgi:hypothetical protein